MECRSRVLLPLLICHDFPSVVNHMPIAPGKVGERSIPMMSWKSSLKPRFAKAFKPCKAKIEPFLCLFNSLFCLGETDCF